MSSNCQCLQRYILLKQRRFIEHSCTENGMAQRQNLPGETIAAKSDSRKTNGERAMHFTSKVKDNQKSTAFLASSFGKQKNDFPGHLYCLFVQSITALHTSPSPCNFNYLLPGPWRFAYCIYIYDPFGNVHIIGKVEH